jgi:purine-binding chemotaxis protein CheW
VFACGAGLYGVPSELASEVVNLPALTRVPGAPAHVLGVFALRGEVLPVIDLVKLVGGAPTEAPWKRAVVIRVAQGVVALTATRVLGVAALEGAGGPLGSTGVQQHLRGPLKAPAGDVAAIEPEGLVAFLARGG